MHFLTNPNGTKIKKPAEIVIFSNEGLLFQPNTSLYMLLKAVPAGVDVELKS